MPLVRVCAAGVGSVWSWRWRTWRRAFTTGFTLDMLKNVRFLRGLGRMAGSQCVYHPRAEAAYQMRGGNKLYCVHSC